MNYKIGDFVIYSQDQIKEYCIIVGDNLELRTVEVLDNIKCGRYFESSFDTTEDFIEPITDEKIINRLRKLVVFK